MRTLRNLSIIIFIILFSISSCIKPRLKPFQKLTDIYVETGEVINDTLFNNNRPFNPTDKTLGKIDSTKCNRKFNGYKTLNGYNYVFENDSVPNVIKSLTKQLIYNCLTNAGWVSDNFKYELKNDALICEKEKEYTYFSRLKSDIIYREKAIILGQKVYRFKDKVYKEDYQNFVDYHSFLRKTINTENLYTKLGISSATHTMEKERSSLIINAIDGTINIDSSSPTVLSSTPNQNFDRIFFRPKSGNGETFLLRVILMKHSSSYLKEVFNYNQELYKNSEVKTMQAISIERFTNDIKKEILPKFWPIFIRNYNCNGCNNNSRIALPPTSSLVPPLPVIING